MHSAGLAATEVDGGGDHADRVICLCAAWCGVCRDWQPAFDAAARAHPAWRFDWVDVEDEAEAMDDHDIQTFPTLLVLRAGRPLFLGPVPPTAGAVARLLAGLVDGTPSPALPPDADAPARRLPAGPLPLS